MAKEAITKSESFDNDSGDAPVIDLEGREIKSIEEGQSDQGEEGQSAPDDAAADGAAIDVKPAETAAETVEDGADRPPSASGEMDESPQATIDDKLDSLIAALKGIREGRDAVSMRRDLVSLHDKLIPEIQAARDAAKQSEAAIQSTSGASEELKAAVAKIDGSISGLEGYLLVNLEERLQAIGQSVKGNDRSGRLALWLKLAVAGNFLLTALVLAVLVWPAESRGMLDAVSSFSIDAWLKSLEPRP